MALYATRIKSECIKMIDYTNEQLNCQKYHNDELSF